jgi:hypothetical protein
MLDPVTPKKVRYVKLGEGDIWEKDCLTRSVLRISFGSDTDRGYALCKSGNWDGFAAMWRENGRTHSNIDLIDLYAAGIRSLRRVCFLLSRVARFLFYIRRWANECAFAHLSAEAPS